MRRLGFLAFVIPFAAGLASCAQSSASVYINAVLAPNAMNSCAVDASSAALSGGSWDVNANTAYVLSFQVNNALRTRTSPTASNPNAVQIKEVEVTVLDPSGAQIANYTVPASGSTIQSSTDGLTPGTGFVSATVIPAQAAGTLAPFHGQQITLLMKLHGETLGTVNVDSGDFAFPVTILAGELAYSQTQCYAAGTATKLTTDPCSPGANGGRYCPPCVMATGLQCP